MIASFPQELFSLCVDKKGIQVGKNTKMCMRDFNICSVCKRNTVELVISLQSMKWACASGITY